MSIKNLQKHDRAMRNLQIRTLFCLPIERLTLERAGAAFDLSTASVLKILAAGQVPASRVGRARLGSWVDAEGGPLHRAFTAEGGQLAGSWAETLTAAAQAAGKTWLAQATAELEAFAAGLNIDREAA
jgi:hypothetical protein